MSWFPLSILVSFLSLSLAMSSLAQAQAGHECMETLSSDLQKEFDARIWSFHGVRSLNPTTVDEKLSRYIGSRVPMGESEAQAISELSKQPGFEFYFITGTTDYAVGFMDLVIVEVKSCKSVKRKTVYFE